MKIGKLTAIASFAAVLAASQAWASDSSFNGGSEDETGFSTIGVDITNAGGTPEAVHQFVAQLASQTAQSVERGCQTALTYPSGYNSNVLAFCQNLQGSGASNEALGFMATERSKNPLASPAPAY